MLLLGSCNKDSQMSELGDSKARAQKRWPVASIAAGLLAAAALCQPDLAHAAHGGGGGGFHGGGVGGFHGGVANLHNGFGGGHGGHWYRGRYNGGYGWGWGDGLGWSYYPYDYGYGYSYY